MRGFALAKRGGGAGVKRAAPPVSRRAPKARKHEREADAAARRFVRGDRGLARGLTPAPAASAHVAGSRAEPMASELRRSLEVAFGADLAVIRVHRDAAAARATSAIGAHAFASGASIFFAEGAYAPDGEAGRALIAHEVAHVLQQTGRMGSSGLAATRASGAGVVQCLGYPDIAKQHGKGAPADYAAIEKRIREIHLDKAKLEAFAASEAKNLGTWPEAAESLLYDTLKLHDAYEAAARLLERDEFAGALRIKTVFWSSGIVGELDKRKTAPSPYEVALKKEPALKLYLAEWKRLVALTMLQPARFQTPPLLRNLDPASGAKSKKWENIDDHLEGLRKTYDGATITANEWFFESLQRMVYLDAWRRKRTDAARAEAVEKRPGSDIEQRRYLTYRLRDWGNDLKTYKLKDAAGAVDVARTAQWQKFHESMGDWVIAAADRVLRLWDREAEVRFLFFDLRGKPREEVDAALAKKDPKALEQFRRLAQKSGVATTIALALRDLNRSDATGNREPADYDVRSYAWGDKLEAQATSAIDKPMPGWMAANKEDEIVGAMWLRRHVEAIVTLLRMQRFPYGAPPKPGTATVTVTLLDADHIHAHRIDIANASRALGEIARSSEIVDTADQILTAALEKDSVIVLLPDEQGVLWHRGNVDPPEAVEDFADAPIEGVEPVTVYDLVLLGHATYYEALARELASQLPKTAKEEEEAAAKGNIVPNALSKSAKAVRADLEKKGLVPERWEVPNEDGRHVFFAQKPGGKKYYEALRDRLNKEQFYYEARTTKSMEDIVPRRFQGRAFVWLWPRYSRLVKFLRGIPELSNELALSMPEGEGTLAKRLAAVNALDDGAWYAKLRKLFEAKFSLEADAKDVYSEEKRKALKQRTEDEAQELLEKRLKEIEPIFHKAARMERKRLAPLLDANLREYAKNRNLDKYAEEALRTLRRFQLAQMFAFAQLASKEDELTVLGADEAYSESRLHMAALVLELAPAMKAAFAGIRLGKIVYGYLGIVEDAVESAELLRPANAANEAATLLEGERGGTWVGAHLADLVAVQTELRKVRAEVQKGEGFTAKEDSNTLHVGITYSSPIKANDVLYPRSGRGVLGLDPTGKRYRLVKVLRSFRYHPPYGSPRVDDSSPARTGYSPAMVKELDDETDIDFSAGENKLLKMEELDANGEVKREFLVGGETPEDFELLAEIHSGAQALAFGYAMSNIMEGIETYIDILLDVGELIPGWGQVITGARVAKAIADFWASDAYKDLLAVLNGDVSAMLDGLVTKLKEIAKPESLFILLLFGDPLLDRLLAGATDTQGAKADKIAGRGGNVSKSKFGKLRDTVRGLRKLGSGFVRAAHRLNEKIEQPMQDFREFASTRPALSLALQFAGSHIYQIMDLAQDALSLALASSEDVQEGKKTGENVQDTVKRTVGDQQKEFGTRVHELMNTLQHLELPHEIINLVPAVQFILDQLVWYVGKRLGLQAKVVLIVLNRTGAIGVFTEKIAQEIVEKGYDPNKYWREEVIPLIADKFTEMRDALVAEINSILESKPFKSLFDTVPAGSKLALAPNQDETYHEIAAESAAQPAAAGDRVLNPRPTGLPPVVGGGPLPVHTQLRARDRLRRDFSHVRIHRGTQGERMTEAFGAEALTTGSHIYLRASVDPDSLHGRRILGHELMHVSQQTGPRPVDGRRDATPRTGRPERGLAVDPAMEAQADAAANAFASDDSAQLDEEASVAADAGFQPNLGDHIDPYYVARLLREFTNLPKIKEKGEALDAKKGKASLSSKDDEAFVESVLDAISSPAKVKAFLAPTSAVPKVFSKVVGDIVRLLGDKLKRDDVVNAVYEIAKEALDDLPSPPAAPGANKPKKVPRYIRPGHFKRALEGYILSRSGIAVSLSFTTVEKTAPSGTVVEALDPTCKLEKMSVLHVYLPYIHGNHNLWTLALENTWPVTKTDAKERDILRSLVGTELAGAGIKASVWAMFGDEYQFSILFKRRIAKIRETSLSGDLDPNNLPAPDAYATSNPSQSPYIGVRLATYGDASQVAPGRHSHHLTQFLVADYFANTAKAQPFKKKGRTYPGIQWKGQEVDMIAPQGDAPTIAGPDTVEVLKTRGKERGEEMPAISLSAATHMSGDLHITPEADDLKRTVSKTQANAVDRVFRSLLPGPLHANASDVGFANYVKTHGREDAGKEIHAAVQGTYRKWSQHMNSRLLANMARLETVYYCAVASSSNDAAIKAVSTDQGKQTLLQGKLHAVAKTAAQHNLDVMDKLGWR
ncbi:MAG: DUF4157 domain-containing protein [Burkholderiales bacterium]